VYLGQCTKSMASVRTGLDRYSGSYGRHCQKSSKKWALGPRGPPNYISCISLCRAVDGLESYGKSADDINKRSSMVKSVWGRVLPMLQTVPEAPIFKNFFFARRKINSKSRALCAKLLISTLSFVWSINRQPRVQTINISFLQPL
jgi:hypothetical protein